MLRSILIWLVVISSPVLVFANEESPFSVDFFCGWGGYYRPMEWTPVEISITSSLTEPFAGSLTISTQQDGLNTLNVINSFVITPEVVQHLPLVTKIAFAANNCTLKICNERGRVQWREEYDLWDFSTQSRFMVPVNEKDLLVGLIGLKQFGILRLPNQAICTTASTKGKVYIGDKLPRLVPWDWTGFVPLDVLVLYDPNWDTLNEHQLNAIGQWVSNGGKLLLVLGTHPLSVSNPIAELLPFELRDVKQVEVPTDALDKWGLTSDKPDNVTAWSLKPKSDARYYEIQTNDSGECLFATGYAGFGRVGVLTFNPFELDIERRVNSAQFWVNCIKEVLYDSKTSSGDTRRREQSSIRLTHYIEFVEDSKEALKESDENKHQYKVGVSYAASNAVMEFLYRGIKPLSIWWVLFLLTTLAILLGPFDYKILKRLDRLPWTWLTCSVWIVIFTVGAYYGVQMIHGHTLELKVVSVLDGLENSDDGWSTRYCGLFAPRNAEYQLEGLEQNQWWSGIAPTQEHIWSYNRELATRNIYCYQHDGGNLPFSLPVNIWSIQCLINESPLKQLPFSADFEIQDNDLVLNITNHSETPVSRGYVLMDNSRGIDFDQIPPLAAKTFRSRLRNTRHWSESTVGRYREYSDNRINYSGRFDNEDAFFAQGSLQRTETIESYLACGAAVVCVQYDQAPVSFSVKNRSCSYDHIQLVRLIVFPKESVEEEKDD